MRKLSQLDELVIDVIIDNQSDSYSTKPPYVVPEFNNVIAAGAREISGKTLCCAQLGLSLLLTAKSGDRRHKLLFDAGPEGPTWLANARRLGLDLSDVQSVAVSHGHWDHMGALLTALGEITGGKRNVDCHVNPDMFVERGARLTDGRVVPFELVPSPEELTASGARVVSDLAERTLLDDFFYLSGEIPRVSEFEKGRVDHLSRPDKDSEWQPDPMLMDERYLACHLKDRGMIVFSSCSHAGIINVLHDLSLTFAGIPLYGVFGGFHLVGSLEKIIPQTVEAMKGFKPARIMPGHCTGWRAVVAMVNAFGEEVVVPSAVGSRYVLSL